MSANILVVEDDFLVAMQIETVLREAGLGVTGPAGTLANAVKLARSAACDGAVLDVNLRGERVDEVATILSERGRFGNAAVGPAFTLRASIGFKRDAPSTAHLPKPCPWK
jgi:DNA-binding NarL/FixJ family response regulator